MAIIKHIKKENFNVTKWSGGITSQIYIYPENTNYKDIDFKFRISSATVELETSNFTRLDGVYRFITPIDDKLKLTHDYKNYIELEPFQIYDFDGGISTTSYGIAKDFNLMLANGAKGSLTSIYIDKGYVLNETLNTNQFSIIISDSDIDIETNRQTYFLKAMEALIISSTNDTSEAIKIDVNNHSNILIARVYVG